MRMFQRRSHTKASISLDNGSAHFVPQQLLAWEVLVVSLALWHSEVKTLQHIGKIRIANGVNNSNRWPGLDCTRALLLLL